ncbi:CD5 antigen-like [Pollicipes pollicipes]|uniref:CD5 antigen-like n=1 Tax=Pollicipes pollicipes TaxID=41117 RepID=UPI00188521DD|nr:CD5 antigen-like [Pollicipes pollicipes]
MLLPLLVTLLLGQAWADLSPTPATGDTSLEQVLTELATFYESTVRAATAAAHQSMTQDLDHIKQTLAALVFRLDSLQEVQSSVSSRLDSLQEVQSSVSPRLDSVQEAQVSFSSKLNSMQSSVSSRLDAVQQSVAAVSCRPEALLDGLVNIQTAVNRLPWRVLGDACENNADCFRAVPSSECGSDGTCTCTAGFRRISRSECRARLLSEPCTTNSECQAATAHSVCTDGACACATGYWNRTNNECRPGVSAGQTCTFDQDCSTHRSNFTCNSGMCSERVCPGVVRGGYEYRLAGGDYCAQGRVELRPVGGTWGYVCDDSWENVDASVACRTLGFSAGRAHCCSAYGAGGPENFYMDDVNCSGSESHLKNCPHNTVDNCHRGEVAAVTCSGPQQNA